MKPVPEPEDEQRPVDLGLRIEIDRADRAAQLVEDVRPPGHLPTLWGGRLRASRGVGWGCWFWHGGGKLSFPCSPNLHRQPRKRRLDQEARLGIPPPPPLPVQHRIQHPRGPPRPAHIT